MLTKELETVIRSAITDANNRRHEYVGLEHLLLSLLYDETTANIIRACGGDISVLKIQVDEYLRDEVVPLPENIEEPAVQTRSLQRLLNQVLLAVHRLDKPSADGVDVLVALYNEEESHALYFLKNQGVTREDVEFHVQTISYESAFEQEENSVENKSNASKKNIKRSPLEMHATNLTQLAKEGLLDPLIGRQHELERTMQILCRRKKNNPLYIGDPGVGKTVIADGLARLITSKAVPSALEGMQIYSLDMGAVVAGTKFRGEFEQRLKSILKDIKKRNNVILFIDEIHTVIRAGSTNNGAMDASNILKPALSSGELRCIGATTYSEYKDVFLKDMALSRRFQKVDVLEPSIEESVKILRGLQHKYEEHFRVKYTVSALKAAVELSQRYINSGKLPDKAIDVIDEAGAMCKLMPVHKRKSQIGVADIEKIVSSISGIPAPRLSSESVSALKSLETDLKRQIYGQDLAIGQIVSAIKRNKAGLGNTQKPIGIFLFTGPTGVGKTEISKQLAKMMNVHFERFDMSEYMEKHSASRLIGSPPGYVGFEQGGLLTEAVKRYPYSVFLLDEIEKAHQDVYNVLLQVMDYGQLTDNSGTKANFRNIILIMTSNIGAKEGNAKTIGFNSVTHAKEQEAINREFSPEFRNRLDSIVTFEKLAPEIMNSIVNKFIDELQVSLFEKKISIKFSDKSKKWLSKNGYNEEFGARPMSRLIQTEIKDKLSDEILFGSLVKGGQIEIDEKDNSLIFRFVTIPSKPSASRKKKELS